MKFNVQDRIVLDEMVDTFTREMHNNMDEAKLADKRPIITRAILVADDRTEVQQKIDGFTTVKALKHSNKYR